MKRRQVIFPVSVLLALTGGGITLFVLQQQSRSEQAVQRLLAATRVELQRERPDTDGIARLLRSLKRQDVLAPDRRLVRARARLELWRGRAEAAWQAIEPLALPLEPALEDALLGARILLAVHAVKGQNEDLVRAMGLAEQHAEKMGDVTSQFLAWQCADRAGRVDDRERLARELLKENADTPEGRFLRAVRGRGQDPATVLQSLRSLQTEFRKPPEELDLAIAYLLLGQNPEPGDGAFQEAVDRLESVLSSFPVSIKARDLRVLTLDRLGDRKQRDFHLKWLLEHTPEDHPRRSVWRKMLGG